MNARVRYGVVTVLLAGLVWATGLWAVLGGLPQRQIDSTPTVVLYLLLRPTATPTLSPTPWPSPTATRTATPLPRDAFAIGRFVQVRGTGGLGLRVREQPSLTATVRFLARETEVFRILEGPVEADGHVWWYVAAPYASSRRGWVVQDFLDVLPLTPTPVQD
ncbi:MAG: hypothetical protein GXO54_01895 [Chloroflexi bacterium]|nr:hypothetical protein [Chloroflexota bacterium]